MLTAPLNDVGCFSSILAAQNPTVLQPMADQWSGVTRKCRITSSLTSVASHESACGPCGTSVYSVSRGARDGHRWDDGD